MCKSDSRSGDTIPRAYYHGSCEKFLSASKTEIYHELVHNSLQFNLTVQQEQAWCTCCGLGFAVDSTSQRTRAAWPDVRGKAENSQTPAPFIKSGGLPRVLPGGPPFRIFYAFTDFAALQSLAEELLELRDFEVDVLGDVVGADVRRAGDEVELFIVRAGRFGKGVERHVERVGFLARHH